MIRIGTHAAQSFNLAKNLETQARIQEARIQISSGKTSQRYDGIAADTRRLESLETRHAAVSAFGKSIDQTISRMKEMESVVGGLQDIASRYRSLLIQASSGDNLNKGNVQEQASQLRDEVVAKLNTDFEGRYLFAGSRTDTPPIDAANITGAYYQGDGQTLAVRADEGQTIDYGVTADPAAATGFDDLIQALNQVAEAAPLTDADLDAALADVNAAIPRLADTRADIGSTHDQLERTSERLKDQAVKLEGDISSIEDIDPAEAMTRLSTDQITLESSYAVTARLGRTSLLNFLS